MRPFITFVLSIVSLLGVATIAQAKCTNTAYASIGDGYVLQDFGGMASKKPSLQAGVTRTCGKWSFDTWTATELATKGVYGKRGYGDEVDFTVNYDTKVDTTPIGPLTIQGSAAYYILSSFGKTNDDMVQLYVDVGRPMQIRKTTVTPYVRPIQWVGLGALSDETLLRTGVRFARPLGKTLSLDGDVAHTQQLTSNKSVWLAKAFVNKDLGGGFTASVGAKITERNPVVASIGIAKSF